MCSCPANGYAFTTHLTHCEAMTSIKDWQDSMSEVDGWAEMVDYIDEDDVKRWNADRKMDPQKSKSALNFAVKGDSMRVHLFADNYFLRSN